MADKAKLKDYIAQVGRLETQKAALEKRLEEAQKNNDSVAVKNLSSQLAEVNNDYMAKVSETYSAYEAEYPNKDRSWISKKIDDGLNDNRKENKLPGAEYSWLDTYQQISDQVTSNGSPATQPAKAINEGIIEHQEKKEAKERKKERERIAAEERIAEREKRLNNAEGTENNAELTTPSYTPETKTEEAGIKETSTSEPEEKTNRKSFRDYIGDVGNYATALTDTIGAAYKQRANNARSLAGYAGQFAPSGGQPFSEEAAKSPFQKIREQTYENINSRLRAEQAAINAGEQQKITNEYKSVYDIANMNEAQRNAYTAQMLGEISNGLQLDLTKDLRKVNKEELQNYLAQLKDRVGAIKDNVIAKGIKDGLIESIDELIMLNAEGKLEERILNISGVNPVTGAASAGVSIGNGLANVFSSSLGALTSAIK